MAKKVKLLLMSMLSLLVLQGTIFGDAGAENMDNEEDMPSEKVDGSPISEETYKLFGAEYMQDEKSIDSIYLQKLTKYIPEGYALKEWYGVNTIGDLNGDGIDDIILTVQGTNRKKICPCSKSKSCEEYYAEKVEDEEDEDDYYEGENEENDYYGEDNDNENVSYDDKNDSEAEEKEEVRMCDYNPWGYIIMFGKRDGSFETIMDQKIGSRAIMRMMVVIFHLADFIQLKGSICVSI